MSLSYAILGFLSCGSMSGYDLAKALSSSINFFWYAQNSQIYLELNKLEAEKCVTGELVFQTEKPNKKIFSITKKGKDKLQSWLVGEDKKQKGYKNPFLMKIFFMGEAPREYAEQVLKDYLAERKAYLAAMGTIPQNMEKFVKLAPKDKTMFWDFSADYGISLTKMNIEWAERCLEKLTKN